MALFQCNFYSEALMMNTSMNVILPQHTRTQIGMDNIKSGDKHPTLYLLHGLTDDDTAWLRRTSIERYVADLGLAVVMPQVHQSFYTDMAQGNRYWTFLNEELPEIARSFFPLSEAREDNYVAGLSMGGYGAMKLALRRPDQYIAAASLSGALDMSNPVFWKDFPMNYNHIFGEEDIRGTDNDILHLLQQCDQTVGPKPLLYQCCGTEDFLYEHNQTFRNVCTRTDLKLTYEEEPGDHNWEYWDNKIQDVLKWLPLRKR
ncbi:alpha/beta hydrolase [Paenibacillus glacialis]|uniref:Esterase n=1 Tax=Paenibacillus glacialis TaxID=494026 RepID=A0A169ZHS6_9BACL|nr:alpha/beta hydrolase family protein [Paenibacillus glacialis]OAB39824.1 esterase [Paenibacillus glacialis]